MITKNRLHLFLPALVLLGILLAAILAGTASTAQAQYPTPTRTRTATAGPSLTRTRTATTGPSLTPTLTVAHTPTQDAWIGIALASNFPNTVYIGGNNVMVTVSTNPENQNAIFSIIVIDAATGQEQSQTNPIVSPARPAPQTANQILGNLANFSFDGVRPGTVFFRASVTGTQASLTKDSTNVTVVSGPTPTKTSTPTRTPTPVPGHCSPVDATITVPFVQNGVGNFCWKASTINWINSFNTGSVNVNGVNFTNLFASSASFPAQIGGFWYITYIGNFPWSHFEAQ